MHEKFSEKSIWAIAVFDDSEEASSRVQINFLKVYHEKKKEMNKGTKGGYQLGALRGGVTVPEGVQSQKVLKFCILMTSRGPNLWLSMTY